MTRVTPKLSPTIPPKGLASLSTINAAITPWRDAFAEQTSLPLLAHRGWKPLPQGSFSPSLPLGEKDGHSRGRSRWFVHNAGYHDPLTPGYPCGRQPKRKGGPTGPQGNFKQHWYRDGLLSRPPGFLRQPCRVACDFPAVRSVFRILRLRVHIVNAGNYPIRGGRALLPW
jgi:hypothetical protein